MSEHQSLSHHLPRWLHTFPQYRIAGTNTRTQPASLGDNSLQLKPLFFFQTSSPNKVLSAFEIVAEIPPPLLRKEQGGLLCPTKDS